MDVNFQNILSPEDVKVPSTKSQDTGDNGYTRDNFDTMEMENIIKDEEGNHSPRVDSLIGYTKPFYHCKQHPNVQNINEKEIEHHIQYSKEHQSP